jgi:2-polyprenyl-6-methoxyphenol hydroxylase-like FAD-dependent oxidoreductase
MQYRLVERRARGSTGGLALNLPGNAVAALHTLGAADEVIAAGVPVARREYRTAGGRLLFAVDEARFWSGSTPSVCARHHVVVDALAAGVSVEHGMAVTSLAHRADAGVAVTFADGQQDRFDFVVAADGVRSTVRSAVAPAAPRPSLMTAASWRFVTSEVGIDCWTAWTGRGRTFLLIPVATPGPTRPGSARRLPPSRRRSRERSTRPSRQRIRRTTHRSRRCGSPPGTTTAPP